MRQILFALVTALLVAVIAVLLWRYAQEDKPKGLKESLPITRYVLGNGLTVLVVENHRIPAVSHTLFIKAGSAEYVSRSLVRFARIFDMSLTASSLLGRFCMSYSCPSGPSMRTEFSVPMNCDITATPTTAAATDNIV